MNEYKITWRLINYKDNPHVWEMIVITPHNIKFMGHVAGIRAVNADFVFDLFKNTDDIFFIEIDTVKPESLKKEIKLLTY